MPTELAGCDGFHREGHASSLQGGPQWHARVHQIIGSWIDGYTVPEIKPSKVKG
jgi:hypothetical protein